MGGQSAILLQRFKGKIGRTHDGPGPPLVVASGMPGTTGLETPLEHVNLKCIPKTFQMVYIAMFNIELLVVF